MLKIDDDSSIEINPPIVKPFRLTYLAKGGGGGGEGVPAQPPHPLNLNHCFCLLLTYRPILGLPEYKIKYINICECTGQGVLKLWCLTDFSNM